MSGRGTWGTFERPPDETWRMGSSLMSWMTLGESEDHVLKVSWYYLYFLAEIQEIVVFEKNVMDRYTD